MQLHLDNKQSHYSDITTFYWSASDDIIWRAGQYGVFYLEHQDCDTSGPERFFTISNPPHLQPISFTTRISASSYKQALNAMSAGDTITLKSIGGEFIISDLRAPYVFIAIGIGITPFRSILLDAAYRHLPIKATLLYQHDPQEYLFESDFLNVQQNIDLQIQHFNHSHQLSEYINQQLPQYKLCNFYISGPIPAVEQLEEMLIDNNIDSSNIYCDYFEYDWSQLP